MLLKSAHLIRNNNFLTNIQDFFGQQPWRSKWPMLSHLWRIILKRRRRKFLTCENVVIGPYGAAALHLPSNIITNYSNRERAPLTIWCFCDIYYLEHTFVGKHYGAYPCLKQTIHIKIGEILKLHRISELTPPTAFFYLNSFRNDK